jgi:hypothetical protein
MRSSAAARCCSGRSSDRRLFFLQPPGGIEAYTTLKIAASLFPRATPVKQFIPTPFPHACRRGAPVRPFCSPLQGPPYVRHPNPDSRFDSCCSAPLRCVQP